MFLHNFKYSLKTLLKSKILLFWTFAFPIILGVFFNMAFSDIENSEKLNIIDISIVDSEEFKNNKIFKETFEVLSDEENENRMFNLTITSLEKSKAMLENNEITGYITFENEDASIIVNTSGINETILRYVVDEIQSNSEIIQNLAEKEIESNYKEGNFNINYEKIYAGIEELIENSSARLNNVSNKNLSYIVIEYYTLIAMSCLYGGILSMFIVNYKLANMKSVGKRTAVSGISKGKLLLGSLLASYVVQLIGITILFIFLIFVLKVNFGTNLLNIIILACVGSLAGLSLGVLVGVLVKANENAKTGILVGITMLGSFLSGMMGITMKYIIDKNVPILNKINPVSMITDGFYSLYYYDTLDRFYFNLLSLLIFSAIAMLVALQGLRRQKYDSI